MPLIAQLVLGIGAVALSLALRYLLDPLVGDRIPLILTVAALAALSWILAPVAYWTAAAVGILVADYLFLQPRYSFGPEGVGAALQLGSYIVLVTLLWIAARIARRHSSRAIAASASALEKDALLRVVADGSQTLLAYVDRDLRYRFVNAAYCRYFNVSAEDVLRRTVREQLGEDAFAALRPYIDRVMAGESVAFETNLPYPALGLRRMSVGYSPHFGRDGAVAGYTAAINDITDRARAEEAAARLAAIVESTDDAVLSKDLTGRILSFNAAAERLFGYHAADIVGQPITLLVPEDRREEEAEILGRIRAGERVEHLETVRLTKSGRRVEVSLTVSPIRSPSGEIIGASKIVRDITQRKAAESDLRRSEERLRIALEAGKMGTWEWDMRTGAVAWSPGLEVIHGLEPGTFGGSFEDFRRDIHPDDRERVLRTISSSAELRQEHHIEYRIVLPNGQTRWVEGRGRVATDARGTPISMSGICADITERRRAEAALRDNEARLRLALDAAHAGAWEWDLRTDVHDWTPELYRLFGIDPASPNPRDAALATVHPDDRDAVIAAADRAARATGELDLEYRVNHPDGSLRWFAVTGRWSPDRTRLAGITLDITARRAAEAKLRESQDHIRRLMMVLPVGLYTCAADGRITFFNPVAASMWGREPAPGEADERYCGSVRLWLPDGSELPHDRTPMAAALVDGRPRRNEEVTIERPDGTRIDALVNIEPLHDADGRPAGAINVFADITERKRAEAQVHAAHDTFRHLVENSPFGVYAVNGDFQLVQVSVGAQKVFQNVQPLLGRDFAEVLREIWPEPFATEVIGIFRHTLETGEPFHAPSTTERRRDSGDIESYDWKVERITLPDGRFGAVCHFYDLSERQHYEQALRDSENKRRVALEAAELGTWTYRFVDHAWNLDEQAQKLYGTASGQLLHDEESVKSFLHPDDIPAMWEAVARACDPAGDGRYACEYRIRRRDGGVRWLAAWARVEFDGEGPARRAVRMVGASRDITERRQAEEALRRSESQLALEVQTLTSLHALSNRLLNAGGIEAVANETLDALLEVLGADKGTLQFYDPAADGLRYLAHRGFDAAALEFMPVVCAGFHSTCARALAARGRIIVEDFESDPAAAEHREVAANLGYRAAQSTPLLASSGEIIGMVTTHFRRPHRFNERELRTVDLVIDRAASLMERARATEQLQESEERFRNLADTMAQFAWMADETGWISWYNRRWHEYTGTTPEEMEGWGWVKVHHPDHAQRIVDSFSSAVKRGEPWEDTFPLRSASGEYRWFLSRALPIRDASGRIIRWFGTNTDITDLRNAEQQLDRYRDHLEHLVAERTAELERSQHALRLAERMAALGTFAAGLGHDMGNLLLPIRARIESIEAHPGADPEIRQDAEAIRGSLRYVEAVTRGLRLFAQDPEQDADGITDLARWCGDVESLMRASLPKSITLRCDIPASTPHAAVAPHRLSQAILNLVHNARDAITVARGRDAHGVIELSASAEPNATTVRITVRDDGPGMSDEVRARCLEPFFTTKSRGLGGTGLGLAIVHGLAERAGGRVEIDSAPGRGAAISIILPVADARAPDKPRPRTRVYLTLSDPRTAAFATSLVTSMGREPVAAPPAEDEPPGSLWITDATADAEAIAARLVAAGRERRIIALGGNGEWSALGAVTIADASSLAQLRRALEQALAATPPPA